MRRDRTSPHAVAQGSSSCPKGDGDADLELGGLTVEVLGHQPLPQQLHAVHLGLDAAAAVVAGPLPPDSPAEALDGPKGLVPRPRTRALFLPWLGVSAGRDDRFRSTVCDGVAAGAAIIGAIGGDGRPMMKIRSELGKSFPSGSDSFSALHCVNRVRGQAP